MERATRAVNVMILSLLVVATGTGVLAFAVGSPGPARWVTGLHAASGLGLLLLLPAKSRISRRGLRRPGRSRKVVGLVLAVLVLAVVGSGLLHAFGGWTTYLGLLPVQVHVGAAVGAGALLAAHLRVHRRRVRVRATDLDRRRALLGTGIVAGAAVLGVTAPGAARRGTGSHRLAALPVTQWMFDPVPRGAPAVDLAGLPVVTVRAVLDCTGGWYSEQEWTGVPVAALGCGRRRRSTWCRPPATGDGSPPRRHGRCCSPRTSAGGRCGPATAPPCGSSHPGAAGSGG